MILQTLDVWEKSGCSVMACIALNQSDYSILWSSIPFEEINLWLCLSSNQIAGFFDHQYFWEETNDFLVFLHVVSHQVKVASETRPGTNCALDADQVCLGAQNLWNTQFFGCIDFALQKRRKHLDLQSTIGGTKKLIGFRFYRKCPETWASSMVWSCSMYGPRHMA